MHSLYSIIAFVRSKQGSRQHNHAGALRGGGTLLYPTRARISFVVSERRPSELDESSVYSWSTGILWIVRYSTEVSNDSLSLMSRFFLIRTYSYAVPFPFILLTTSDNLPLSRNRLLYCIYFLCPLLYQDTKKIESQLPYSKGKYPLLSGRRRSRHRSQIVVIDTLGDSGDSVLSEHVSVLQRVAFLILLLCI